ncbi:MAG: pentapeptide repeat-containing protein, partial [Chloroflexia bacterium]|nr:pentapeptide repeat-containing protein [Chloroflexia bacterium]
MPYANTAAGHLLARYCLDRAQDLRARLTVGSQFLTPDANNPIDPTFVDAFRAALAPDMTHFREALSWAIQGHEWGLLRRFAYMPYLGLLRDAIFNGLALRTQLIMATIDRPIFRRNTSSSKSSSFEQFTGWALAIYEGQNLRLGCGDPKSNPDAIVRLGHFTLDKRTESVEGCEMQLDITAGYMINGTFDGVEIADARWIGVRAQNAVLRGVDLVNGKLMACDLSRSLWFDCDARSADLTDSNLSFALLRRVRMRGAKLLRVDLTGAVLDNVDLRGADLTGANMTGVRMRDLNLRGARLDGVRWYGASGNILELDQPYEKDVLEGGSQKLASPLPGQYRYVISERDQQDRTVFCVPSAASVIMPPEDYDLVTVSDLKGADLRTVAFDKSQFLTLHMTHADLRCADLTGATLSDVDLNNADLRLANLSDAQISVADFVSANLSGTRLNRAILHEVNLSGADLA